MVSKHEPANCLAAILDNIGDIEDYIAGLERDAFERDGLTRDAVERCIARVCVAVSRLGERVPALVLDQPWSDIGGVGERLRHSCDRIDTDLIWGLIERDLQGLKIVAALALDRLQSDVGDG